MTNQIERRERLAGKCLCLSKIALEQGDVDTFKHLYRKAFCLQLANLAALRLEYPEEFKRQINNNSSIIKFICDGLTCGGRELLIEYGFRNEVLRFEDHD